MLATFASLATLLLPALLSAPARADATFDPSVEYTVTPNSDWDNGARSIYATSCGTALGGSYGALSDIPGFPNLMGTSLIQDVSPVDLCGTCWAATNDEQSTTEYVVMVDTIDGTSENNYAQFAVSEGVMQELTGSRFDDSAQVWLQQVDGSYCGL